MRCAVRPALRCRRSGAPWRSSRASSSFEHCRATLPVSRHAYYALGRLEDPRVAALPFCIRALLETALRTCDGVAVTKEDAATILDFDHKAGRADINWTPPRVILQDLSGVPALIDLCAMRDAVVATGGDARKVNPLSPVDLVVDHSVIIDVARRPDALRRNMEKEMERNRERFEFLKWAQQSFDNFTLVPPGGGIVHQVHCERLARGIMVKDGVAFPDGCVGTDSHTPMVNGLGIVGWGVGGIEAEAAMLGQPMSMVLPEVVGVELTGELPPGVTATDVVLTVTQLLRQHGVVGKFVEFFGIGAAGLTVTDRMTIANMAPEYGATLSFFPTDSRTLDYLRITGRPEEQVMLVEEYTRANGMFGIGDAAGIRYSSVVRLDLSDVVPSLAGPKRPQDRVSLKDLKTDFTNALTAERGLKGFGLDAQHASQAVRVGDVEVRHGQLAIAAITSCTNTSNPSVLLAAGLVAKKAVEKGLSTPEHVKTSLAPGSRVVSKYLEAAGLQQHLDTLGFHVAGYGCTTCMGNSGEVEPLMQAASDGGAITSAILSGNRNFEGRVHLSVKANYITSPPLVVAGALAGRIDIDFDAEPIGQGKDGPVFLRDIWPTPEEVETAVRTYVRPEMFLEVYSGSHAGEAWDALPVGSGLTYNWDPASTYIVKPPFLELTQEPIGEAHCLLLMGDSVTTDHISPVSPIRDGPAFDHLLERGVDRATMSSFGARRGNSEVMVRGTFANPRVFNRLVGEAGNKTVHIPSREVMSVYDAATRYRGEGRDLVVVAGKEYGTGSSRDWAAKGTRLLGIRAVLAESFERIHRSNLVGMGVLPLVFAGAEELGLTGHEVYKIDMPDIVKPGVSVQVTASSDRDTKSFPAKVRLDTEMEVLSWKSGGILPYVLSTM